jgi:hypothetical protein
VVVFLSRGFGVIGGSEAALHDVKQQQQRKKGAHGRTINPTFRKGAESRHRSMLLREMELYVLRFVIAIRLTTTGAVLAPCSSFGTRRRKQAFRAHYNQSKSKSINQCDAFFGTVPDCGAWCKFNMSSSMINAFGLGRHERDAGADFAGLNMRVGESSSSS